MNRVSYTTLALSMTLSLVALGAFDAAAARTTTRPSAPSLAAASWQPTPGPVFNNPYRKNKRFQIENRVVEAINRTPSGETIRIAAYSLDRVRVAKSLIRAKRRGVDVQLLLNDHQYTKAMVMLRGILGNNATKNNFIYRCKNSCRGAKNSNLHTKFYTFSRTGDATDVVMTGSYNMTLNAVKWQWNDLYVSVNNPGIFSDYINLFNQMRVDYKTYQPSYVMCGRVPASECRPEVDDLYTWVLPRQANPSADIIMDILRDIKCEYAGPGGGTRRTSLDISMHTWRGVRGMWLADKVRSMYADGCNIRVNYGLIGWTVKQRLGAPTARGRIPLRSTGYDYNKDKEVDRYTHQKYMIIDGWYRGAARQLVMSGSSNWSTLGTWSDDNITMLQGAATFNKYVANYNVMWRLGYSRNGYTTTMSSFRLGPFGMVPSVRLDLQKDGLKPAGSRWESD